MTILQAIEKANDMRPGNSVADEEKMVWLNDLDHMIYNEVLSHYDIPDLGEWEDYTDDTDTLIVESPYDELYMFWIVAKIDLYQQEYNKYNASVSLFDNSFLNWKKYFKKTHTHKPTPEIKVGVF